MLELKVCTIIPGFIFYHVKIFNYVHRVCVLVYREWQSRTTRGSRVSCFILHVGPGESNSGWQVP